MNRYTIWPALLLLLLTAACRKDPKLQTLAGRDVFRVPGYEWTERPNVTVKGLYILNEGNMNMNKASLDFFDFTTGMYSRNIFGAINPDLVKGLGDVGNDIKIYGSKMYIVVNNSNKVEVVDAVTAKHIRRIDIRQSRYIVFHQNKAFVTSNDGYVAVIDTTSLAVEQQIPVGRNPEQMAIVGNKLYVANSGGYSPPDYEKTVSVVDLTTRQEIKRIDVAINLHRLVADAYGDLYVTSRGDYYDIPASMSVINTKTDQVTKKFDLAVSNIFIHKDRAYLFGHAWSYITHSYVTTYALLDVRTETIISDNFITDGTDKNIRVPYGLMVDPDTEDIFLTDAKNYVTPGTLYCFDKNGKKKYSVTTGDIPAHFVFLPYK